jgi:cytoskeletal protein CcmA (bactofilin family)
MKILKNPLFITALILSLFIGTFSASAATFKNSNELNVVNTEIYNDNSYILTGKNNVSGNFEKDLFVVSGESNFDGIVKGDLFIIGGKVNISGKVLGDLRVIGGEVTVNGELENDLVVIGGKVEISQTANIKGQSLFVGGETNLNAKTDNPVKIISAKTFLNNQTNSDLEVTTQDLIFGSSAKINKGLTYYAPKAATEQAGSVITGTVNFNPITPVQDINFVKRAIINFVSFWLILKFVTTLLIAFILAYIFRIFTKNVVDISLDSFGKSLLLGLLAVFVTPIIIILLLVSLVASPIGVLILIITIALAIIIPAVSGIMAGALIRKFITKKDVYIIDFSTVAIGVVALTFISFVPYLGDITKMILNLVAIGAVGRYTYKNIFKINYPGTQL